MIIKCRSTSCTRLMTRKLVFFGNGLISLHFNLTLSLTHPFCKWNYTRTRIAISQQTQLNVSQFYSMLMGRILSMISKGAAINLCAHILSSGSIYKKYLTTKKDSLRKSKNCAISLSSCLKAVSSQQRGTRGIPRIRRRSKSKKKVLQ